MFATSMTAPEHNPPADDSDDGDVGLIFTRPADADVLALDTPPTDSDPTNAPAGEDAEPAPSSGYAFANIAIGDIPVENVHDNANMRTVFEDIAGLAESIAALGMLEPVLVVPCPITPGMWELRAGGRRFRAIKLLGWTTIPARVLNLDDLRSELAALDHNLQNRGLKGLDLDNALARQKTLYEMIHPETVQGMNQFTRPGDIVHPRFTAAAAKRMGVSETLVRDAVRRAENLGDLAKDAYRDEMVEKADATLLAALPVFQQDELLAKAIQANNPKEARKILREGLRQEALDKRKDRKEKNLAKLEKSLNGKIVTPDDVKFECISAMDLIKRSKVEVRKFDLVHIDFPWSYSNQGLNGAAKSHFAQEDTIDSFVKTMKASYAVAADHAYAAVWITGPMLQDWFANTWDEFGLDSIDESTWRYLSCGVWGKEGPSGIGHHWRGDCEMLLLYKKGHPLPQREDMSNMICTPRGDHSEKPEAWLREMLTTFTPAEGGEVLDLFAGLGSMARAAYLEKRIYNGAEIDATRHKEGALLLASMLLQDAAKASVVENSKTPKAKKVAVA